MTQPAPILGFDEDELYEARVFQEASKPQQLTGQRALEAFAKGVGKMLEFGVKGQKWGQKHLPMKGSRYQATVTQYPVSDDPGMSGRFKLDVHRVHPDYPGRKEFAHATVHDSEQQAQNFARKKFRGIRIGEAKEFGIKGMKWGVRHERPTTGRPPGPVPGTVEQTGKSVMPKPKTPLTAPKPQAPGLAEDPRTLSMMTVGKSAQLALNRKSGRQDINAPSADLHQGAVRSLQNLGYATGEATPPKSRQGYDVWSTTIESPNGHRLQLHSVKSRDSFWHFLSDEEGNTLRHGIAPKTRKSVSREPATLKPKRRTGFESRMQSFSAAVESGHRAGLREAKKPYIYYARPLQKYGSKAEEAEIAAIKEAFPGHRVMALTSCSKKRRGMGYYHGKVDGAAAVVISPRSGRHVTAGVYSEAQHALHNKIPVLALRRGRLKAVKRMKTLGGRPRGNFGKFVIKRKRRA